MRAVLLITLTGIFCALPAEAKPRGNPHLVQAKRLYQALEFEKCLERIERAEKRTSTKKEQVDIQVYGALCAYNIGRSEDAAARFARATELDPSVSLPPKTSPKIIALLERVRKEHAVDADAVNSPAEDLDAPTELAEEPKAVEPQKRALATLAPPERMAAPDPVADSLRGTAATRSYAAPVALGATAALAGGAAAWFGLQARSLEAQANAATFESDGYELGDRARQQATLANVGFGVAVAAASGAVATWLLSGDE